VNVNIEGKAKIKTEASASKNRPNAMQVM